MFFFYRLSLPIILKKEDSLIYIHIIYNLDTLRWYCENTECREIVYQDSFHCTDLGTQLKPIIELFASNEELRTCKKCGTVNHAK